MFALCLCACVPGSYPPPPQYESSCGADLPMLELGFPNPYVQVLGGVLDTGEQGSLWTAAHPRFSFQLNRTRDLGLYLRFTVHERTFASTGPVTLTIRINGDVLDRPRFSSPGLREYLHPVPARLLELRNPVEVAIDVDPCWVGEGKQLLGIVLFKIGFEDHRQ